MALGPSGGRPWGGRPEQGAHPRRPRPTLGRPGSSQGGPQARAGAGICDQNRQRRKLAKRQGVPRAPPPPLGFLQLRVAGRAGRTILLRLGSFSSQGIRLRVHRVRVMPRLQERSSVASPPPPHAPLGHGLAFPVRGPCLCHPPRFPRPLFSVRLGPIGRLARRYIRHPADVESSPTSPTKFVITHRIGAIQPQQTYGRGQNG